MTNLYEKACAAAEFLAESTVLRPRIGIVLGSGLGEFADSIEDAVAVSYAALPHFPQATVEGHSGRMVVGRVGGVPVVAMQGRVHLYEGYTVQQVAFPARVLGLFGVRTLLVTNAAGGIRADLGAGVICGISDQINLTGVNAAVGANDVRFGLDRDTGADTGLRFFDMTAAYDPALLRLAQDEAERQGWTMPTGVYLAVPGPSYETPAEIRAFRTLGADLVGMSTVHEVIVARHMGMRVLGLSLVTNPAAGVTGEKLHHLEVMEVGVQAAARFGALLRAVVPRLTEA